MSTVTGRPGIGSDALDAAARRVSDLLRAGTPVRPVGGRTHWGVGGDPGPGVEVTVPGGVVDYDPAELTVTVGAGTRVADLAAVLGAAGQECPLDPRDPSATVGGTLAAGLSGRRRLRWGPLRDRVLEVRFVIGDGRHIVGGGPTVKNVTGYDMPRLLVGSLGTLGVLTRVILRCQPVPVAAVWSEPVAADPTVVRRGLYAPSCIWWDGRTVSVLVEGHPDDVAAELAASGLRAADHARAGGPPWPEGPVRGRISVAPRSVPEVGAELARVDGLRWAAELGVGTVHVAADRPGPVVGAREVAHGHGGWLLRESGDGLAPFGRDLPQAQVHARLRASLDPRGLLNPGRMPLSSGSLP